MRTDTKTHTDISVIDNSTGTTVYAPDPQVLEKHNANIKYIRDLELKMNGYLTETKDSAPWMFPDQAWTVNGKTNDDTDRDIIKNLVSDIDLNLSNFGYETGSGYEGGYLVSDGIDDKIISSRAFNVSESSTLVGEWELLPTSNDTDISGLAILTIFYLNNTKNGSNLYIRSNSIANTVACKTFKSISFNGDAYDKDWNIIKCTTGDAPSVSEFLRIAFKTSTFTKMKFKNLAIYPKILTKEECIKAYNWLQLQK